MCGIAGLVNYRESEADAFGLMTEIIESQSNRGPDNSSIVAIKEEGLAPMLLGHNRLSIIDVSDNANQPMFDARGAYALVYNGMLYNYQELRVQLQGEGVRFESCSDTEVLLQAYIHWGIECLNKFNGMFAFALVDKKQKKLILVRDRFGVKPLYYRHDNKGFVFASTSRVIAKRYCLCPSKPYLARGLLKGFFDDDSEMTAYDGLNSVAPGHVVEYDYLNNCIKTHQYYDLSRCVYDRVDALGGFSNHELVDLTEHLLIDSVKLRLRSDVTLGVSISGGLDSCLISGLVSQNYKKLHGFHYGNPNDAATEGPLVKIMAKHRNINVHYVMLKKEEIIDCYYKTLVAQDAPFSSLSVVAQNKVFSEASNNGIKVMLGGQGGDEGFMGYRKFLFFYLQSLLREKNYWQLLKYLTSMVPTFWHELPQYKQYLFARKHYYGEPDKPLLKWTNPLDSLGFKAGASLVSRQIQDIMRFSLPTLLRYEDRNSMSNGIETRLPFLDYHLVEHALALPINLKIAKGYGKWVLRTIAKNTVPELIRKARYKRGFDVGTSQWISGGLGDELRGVIAGSLDKINDFTDRRIALDKEYSNQRLIQDRQAMKELITLSWLARKL